MSFLILYLNFIFRKNIMNIEMQSTITNQTRSSRRHSSVINRNTQASINSHLIWSVLNTLCCIGSFVRYMINKIFLSLQFKCANKYFLILVYFAVL